MNISDLRIAFMTCPRKPSYIHQTLGSLFDMEPGIKELSCVDLLIDTADKTFLEEYRDVKLFNLHYLTPEQFKVEKTRTLYVRCCYTCWRCLNLDITGYKGLLVCEDDVIFRQDFLSCLLQTVEEIEKDKLYEYMLSLHSKYNLVESKARHRGKYFLSYPAFKFYGMHGIYYPSQTLARVRDFMFKHGVKKPSKPADLLIGELGEQMQTFFNVAWDLVEHVGRVSTGLSGKSACNAHSPTFDKPWVALGS